MAAAVAALVFPPHPSHAAQYRSRVGLPLPVIWDIASNWVVYDQVLDLWVPGILLQFPKAGDVVEILPGHIVELDSDEAVGVLIIHPGARLETGPHTLTISL